MTDEEIGLLDLTTKIRQDLCTKPIILHSNVVVHAHFLVRPSHTVLSITGDGLGSLQSSPRDLSEMTPSILCEASTLDVPYLDAYPDFVS